MLLISEEKKEDLEREMRELKIYLCDFCNRLAVTVFVVSLLNIVAESTRLKMIAVYSHNC